MIRDKSNYLKILLSVSEEIQRQRVLERPAFLHSRFFESWIPMENRYFAALESRPAEACVGEVWL